MGPEVLILGRQEGLAHKLGDRVDRHEDASFGGQFRQQAAVAGVDPAHDRRLVVPQPFHIRQAGAEMLIGHPAADTAHDPDQCQNTEQGAEQTAQHAHEQVGAPRWRCLGLGRGGLVARVRRGNERVARGQRFGHVNEMVINVRICALVGQFTRLAWRKRLNPAVFVSRFVWRPGRFPACGCYWRNTRRWRASSPPPRRAGVRAFAARLRPWHWT